MTVDQKQQSEKEEPSLEREEISQNSEQTEKVDDLILEQQQKIQELEEEIERLKDAQLRKSAEMDNMRKRLQRDREQIYRTSREAALEAFLPINDDLIRTLQSLKESNASSSYLDGIKLIADKFEDVLQKHSIERIDETGVPFDVDLHDAMLRQKPKDDSIESGTVLQVVENGYKMGDKTLRHAKVIVSE
ncbi:MAG: nucleotide exchange factor GrpE [Balneolaceae bacterium]